jgi:hypothetical protein
MTLNKDYVSAPDVKWIYEKPQHAGAKMMLLTIGCVLVTGTWSGELGENYLAWAAMPKRDKQKEKEVIAAYRDKKARLAAGCKPGGCSALGCEGGIYCWNTDGTAKVAPSTPILDFMRGASE